MYPRPTTFPSLTTTAPTAGLGLVLPWACWARLMACCMGVMGGYLSGSAGPLPIPSLMVLPVRTMLVL